MLDIRLMRGTGHRAARRAGGAILLLAVGLVLQPCAMAGSTPADHDCPHCPPAETHVLPCDVAVAPSCDALDQLNYEARASHHPSKDLPLAVLRLPPALTHEPPRLIGFRPPPQVHPPDSPPLHVLHCIYLN